ncbi:MAG: nitroreductase [Rhodospirillales bacterium]|nr:nitroreductase [Rhodospirillales bacterium]MCB9995107.1 nitroreductase [Rhodospirillales bacterium]
MNTKIIAAKDCPEMLDYLRARRSIPIKQLGGPGPDDAQLAVMLETAARIPDHGKLFPWHFIVFSGQARQQAGDLILEALKKQDPQAAEAKCDLERNRLMRAPVVVGVISRLRPGKHPAWEQILSAGAVCYNLCLAAGAMGFGSNWLTEWYSYDDTFKAGIGLDARDHIAGLIYIGTPDSPPEERPRPEMSKIVTYWTPGVSLNKGDKDYDREGFDFPRAGFSFEQINE